MNAANELVNALQEAISQRLSENDQVVLCKITSKINESQYNVSIAPDFKSTITKVSNMTRYDFEAGEYCYVFKIKNDLNNAFICYKLGKCTNADSVEIQNMIDSSQKINNEKIEELFLQLSSIFTTFIEKFNCFQIVLDPDTSYVGCQAVVYGKLNIGATVIIQNECLTFDPDMIDAEYKFIAFETPKTIKVTGTEIYLTVPYMRSK